VQRGEGLIRQFAHEVFRSIDFKRVELQRFSLFSSHFVVVVVVVAIVTIVGCALNRINFLYYFLKKEI
jgi:hypothetical protein